MKTSSASYSPTTFNYFAVANFDVVGVVLIFGRVDPDLAILFFGNAFVQQQALDRQLRSELEFVESGAQREGDFPCRRALVATFFSVHFFS